MMSISIQDLINNPHLKTSLVAGDGGINNEITWAHACELEDPSNWLIGGELVMTNGIVIPASPNKQVNYLKKLIDCNSSGLAIGKDLHAPPLSDDFIRYANKIGFPILLTDYEIPWIALAKTVATTNANQDYAKILQVMKLYNLIHQKIHNESTSKIIESISEIIGVGIKILDAKSKKVLFNNSTADENLMDQSTLKIKIPASRPVSLILNTNKKENIDTLVMNHISTIIGLLIERDNANYERKKNHGTEILLGLMESRYSMEVTSMLLGEHQLNQQELFLIACSTKEEDYNTSWLHIGLYEQNIPNVLTFKDNKLFVLIPASQVALNKMMKELPTNLHIGVSKSADDHIDIKKMYKEAAWALKSSETLNKGIVFYQDSLSISPFLPNSQSEALELVNDSIGNLIKYDENHQSDLVRTLYVFLSVNQSWKAASESLFIHKQTLVYRVNRIEKILGKKLNNINNVSRIWIVLQIALHLKLIPEFGE